MTTPATGPGHFCIHCGARIAGTAYCGSCGAQQPTGAPPAPAPAVAASTWEMPDSAAPSEQPRPTSSRGWKVPVAVVAVLGLLAAGGFFVVRSGLLGGQASGDTLADVTGEPTRAWTRPSGDAAATHLVLEDDGLVQLDVPYGMSEATLTRIDTRTGETVWERELDNELRSTGRVTLVGVVEGNHVVLAAGEEDSEVTTLVLDGSTGEDVGRLSTYPGPGPIVPDGSAALLLSDGESLARLDPADLGAPAVWQLSGSYHPYLLAAMDNGRYLISASEDSQRIFDMATGQTPEWAQVDNPYGIYHRVTGDVIVRFDFLSNDFTVAEGLDPDGSTTWQAQARYFSFVDLADGSVGIFAVSEPDSGGWEVNRLHPDTGEEMWDQPARIGQAYFVAGPSNRVLAVDEPAGSADLLNADDGSIVRTLHGDHFLRGSSVFYSVVGPDLIAWDSSGAQLWSTRVGESAEIVPVPGQLITYSSGELVAWR
ncbi:MAG: WD40 repeat domain-containing protein [Actinomycetia bacterium]|nr:WD40 repeat domain-containing protein [Actinomycetes bacterium]